MTAEENTDLQSARRTLDKEIEALRMMEKWPRQQLDPSAGFDAEKQPDGLLSPAWENPVTSALKLRRLWPRQAHRLSLYIPAKPATAIWAWLPLTILSLPFLIPAKPKNSQISSFIANVTASL